MKRSQSLAQSLNDVKYEQYVNNLHDRLPQLVDPSDIDCQRWPWELVQNAKDTVVKRSNPEDRYVDITIKYYTDNSGNRKLYFEHNGDQFTNYRRWVNSRQTKHRTVWYRFYDNSCFIFDC